jgi:hypothetical protein
LTGLHPLAWRAPSPLHALVDCPGAGPALVGPRAGPAPGWPCPYFQGQGWRDLRPALRGQPGADPAGPTHREAARAGLQGGAATGALGQQQGWRGSDGGVGAAAAMAGAAGSGGGVREAKAMGGTQQ